MGCKGDGFHEIPGGCVVSSQAQPTELTPRQRTWVTALGLLRALATMVVLIALYYLLPLDHDKNVSVTLIAGLLILLAVTAWQLRKVIHHKHPPVRAVEALATTVPLFLLLFAWAYFTMAANHPANFSTHVLTRTDALYFTVTVFSTVGFGDITAASQAARLVVTAQMLLDLVALGLLVRAFVGAVQVARRQTPPAGGQGIPAGQT
jgi:hypothetical protein